MRSHKALTVSLVTALLFSAILAASANAAPLLTSGSFSRSISSGGSTSFQPAPLGGDGLQWPEFAGEEEDDAGPSPYEGSIVNRSNSNGPGHGASANSGKKAKSNPELNLSFDGLNFRQQRLANGGNQFSVEPPDQGMCAGNGYVLESVNDVLRVFDTAGNALMGVVDLNTFYGYAAAINRTTGVRGPTVTDPTCYFDNATQRWFQVVLTLNTFPNGALTGKNHIDVAVSQTSNPTGLWTIYRVPVQDDGTDGTPNHGCAPGSGPSSATNPNACIGDYPHIGADANGFYVTTNEYDLFGPNYRSAQIYAFSKSQLAATPASVSVTQIDTIGAVAGNPGFTVWPAQSPGNQYATDLGGTEYFLSSNAAEEANGTGSSTDLIVWALTNTQSLNSASPAVNLTNAILPVNQYAIPPKADQKAGNFPLGQCLNDTTTVVTSLGAPFTGCWKAIVGAEPAHNEVISHPDSNDTRMQQVMFANGKLWGALDTALTLNSVNKAGIAWFIVTPSVSGSGVSASVAKQGYLGLANNNVTYPTIGVTQSGRGVMGFTLLGADYYPSAAYASIDALSGVGDIHVIAAGAGPDDGFTGYKALVGNPPRTRWGDYGAAAVDGKSIWVSSEYIAQTCTLSQYISAPFGSCGGTRATLGNWATRISKLTP